MESLPWTSGGFLRRWCVMFIFVTLSHTQMQVKYIYMQWSMGFQSYWYWIRDITRELCRYHSCKCSGSLRRQVSKIAFTASSHCMNLKWIIVSKTIQANLWNLKKLLIEEYACENVDIISILAAVGTWCGAYFSPAQPQVSWWPSSLSWVRIGVSLP